MAVATSHRRVPLAHFSKHILAAPSRQGTHTGVTDDLQLVATSANGVHTLETGASSMHSVTSHATVQRVTGQVATLVILCSKGLHSSMTPVLQDHLIEYNAVLTQQIAQFTEMRHKHMLSGGACAYRPPVMTAMQSTVCTG